MFSLIFDNTHLRELKADEGKYLDREEYEYVNPEET